jgi:hypothetical protein
VAVAVAVAVAVEVASVLARVEVVAVSAVAIVAALLLPLRSSGAYLYDVAGRLLPMPSCRRSELGRQSFNFTCELKYYGVQQVSGITIRCDEFDDF